MSKYFNGLNLRESSKTVKRRILSKKYILFKDNWCLSVCTLIIWAVTGRIQMRLGIYWKKFFHTIEYINLLILFRELDQCLWSRLEEKTWSGGAVQCVFLYWLYWIIFYAIITSFYPYYIISCLTYYQQSISLPTWNLETSYLLWSSGAK